MRKQTTCGLAMMGSAASGAANYSLGGVALERLVSQVSGELRAPVGDRTGLTGLFDILRQMLPAVPIPTATRNHARVKMS